MFGEKGYHCFIRPVLGGGAIASASALFIYTQSSGGGVKRDCNNDSASGHMIFQSERNIPTAPS